MVHVDLSSKPSWYRTINPRGLVPAVVYGGNQTLLESLDICRQLDTLIHHNPLTPSSMEAAHHMQQLLDQADSIISAGSCFEPPAHNQPS